MTRNIDAVLRYWRTSLADAALGEGKFSERDRQRFMKVSADTLRNGVLPKETVDALFKHLPKAKFAGVRLWPLVVNRQVSHGTANADGLPELIAPVVTEALVDHDGKILPQRNAIAHDVLTPLPSDEYSIGTVEALDNFLTAEPFRPEPAPVWARYVTHC